MISNSIKQAKFDNFKNLHRLIIWTILRYFQLNNSYKYSEVYFTSKYIIEKFNLPNEISIKKQPSKQTLIIANKFSLKVFINYLFKLKQVRILDENYFLTSAASSNFRLYYHDFLSEKERHYFKQISITNLKKIKSELFTVENSEILILGTGPSFKEGKNYAINNNLKIITCNSSIYDDQIWEIMNPILCFADPVFHFGNSSEAKKFKNEVISKFKIKKFFIICPVNAMPILINNWGLDKNFIIGLNYEKNNTRDSLINEKLSVKRSSNVFTELMLPIASTLSKKILLAGFDGRKTSDENFWQYSKETFQPLDEHKIEHPSFFSDRNIHTYYKEHLKTLKSQLVKLERNGYVFKNLTFSNIDFLNDRSIDGTNS